MNHTGRFSFQMPFLMKSLLVITAVLHTSRYLIRMCKIISFKNRSIAHTASPENGGNDLTLVTGINVYCKAFGKL